MRGLTSEYNAILQTQGGKAFFSLDPANFL